MRAVVVREFGPPSVLVTEEVGEPVPGAGQVVVEVDCASVTFVETQVRAGRPPDPAMLPRLPAILGNGVGGVVCAVGDTVASRALGRRIIASLRGTGGYAERVVAELGGLIDIPDTLSTEEAAALLADGRTAMMLLRGAAIRPGETVLVEAAGGGVGTLLVQLARNAGARVVGAAGGDRKLATARELGAHVVADYTDDQWRARILEDVGGLDVVFDGVGGTIGRTAFELLRPGARFCLLAWPAAASRPCPRATRSPAR
jgi:NADPH2:quinone reductase